MNKECILDNLEEYINFLRSKNYQKFITLHRSNYLRWAVSVKIGKKTGIWHSNKNTTKATQINLNLNSFTKDKTLYETMQYIDNEFNRLQNILKDDEVLLLYYEKDILNNPYQAYKKVCNFLEIKPDNPKIELKPTNPYPLKALISNYNEVKDYLTNTKYEWMLED
jgi:LPS sulfotransferase NodH